MSTSTRFRAAADDALQGVRPLDGAALRARAHRRQVRATAAGASLATLAVVCVVLVAGGIADPARPPLGSPSASPTGRVTNGIAASLRTDLTDAERATVRVSEEQAVAELRRLRPDLAGSQRTVLLGVFTEDRFELEDGSPLKGRVAWVVTVPGITGHVRGPAGQPKPEATGEFVLVVDARTGQALAQFVEG